MKLGWLVLVLVLAACSQAPPSGGTATPEIRYGAPLPQSARDVRLFADPCRGPLDEGAWASLGFPLPGVRRTLSTGENACRFVGPERERFVTLVVVPARDVLVDTYRVRQFALFAPIAVGGLPATREQATAGSLSCVITVGTAADQGFVVNYDNGTFGPNGRPDDPCGRGRAVAERIVAALPHLPTN